MLKNISRLVSPDLIKVLMEMGHGDEIVFGDSNFPAASRARQGGRVVVRADGHGIPELLEAILPLFPLDYAVDFTAILMDYRQRLPQEPAVWARYKAALSLWPDGSKNYEILAKPDFYERAAKAHAIVATGETEGFANIILRKGVVR
ncbi:MAG: fucose isomerase [Puniceicoccales bacterium]|jgi:L-fucose mutarotase|nr:fucose isomerase [Puniceicoccales bacterium]